MGMADILRAVKAHFAGDRVFRRVSYGGADFQNSYGTDEMPDHDVCDSGDFSADSGGKRVLYGL